jgi:hypothetical protein
VKLNEVKLYLTHTLVPSKTYVFGHTVPSSDMFGHTVPSNTFTSDKFI